jgi:hypothetical protein
MYRETACRADVISRLTSASASEWSASRKVWQAARGASRRPIRPTAQAAWPRTIGCSSVRSAVARSARQLASPVFPRAIAALRRSIQTLARRMAVPRKASRYCSCVRCRSQRRSYSCLIVAGKSGRGTHPLPWPLPRGAVEGELDGDIESVRAGLRVCPRESVSSALVVGSAGVGCCLTAPDLSATKWRTPRAHARRSPGDCRCGSIVGGQTS